MGSIASMFANVTAQTKAALAAPAPAVVDPQMYYNGAPATGAGIWPAGTPVAANPTVVPAAAAVGAGPALISTTGTLIQLPASATTGTYDILGMQINKNYVYAGAAALALILLLSH